MSDEEDGKKDSDIVNKILTTIYFTFMICSIINVLWHLYSIYNYNYNNKSLLDNLWVYIKLIVQIVFIIILIYPIYYLYRCINNNDNNKCYTLTDPKTYTHLILIIFINFVGFISMTHHEEEDKPEEKTPS